MADEDLNMHIRTDADLTDLEEARDVAAEVDDRTVTIPVETTGGDQAAAELTKVGDAGEDALARFRAKFPEFAADLDDIKAKSQEAVAALEQSGDSTASALTKPGAAAKQTGGEISNMAGNAVGDLAQVAGASGAAGNAVGGIAQKALAAASAIGGMGVATGIGAVVGVAMIGMQKAAERAKKAAEDLKQAIIDLGRVADDEVLSTFNRVVVDSFKSGTNLKKVLADMAEQQPENARRTLAVLEATEGYAGAADMLREALVKADAAEQQNIKTKEQYKSAAEKAEDATKVFTERAEEGAKAQEELADNLAVVEDAARAVNDAFKDGSERADALGRAFDKVNKGSALDFSQMAANTVQSFDDLKGAMADVQDLGSKPLVPTTVESLRGLSDESAKVIDSIGSMRDSIQTELAAAMTSAGGNFDELRGKASFFRDQITQQFTDVFKGMGLNSDEAKVKVDELLTALGLMPDQVETEIRVTKEQEAMRKIELFGSALANLPPEVQAKVATQLDENDPINAWNTINTAVQEQGKVHVGTTVDDAKNMPAVLAKAQMQANAGVTVPVTLAVDRAKQKIAGIFGGGGSGSDRSVSSSPSSFVTINLPRGSRSTDVLRAVQGHTRRSGRHYGSATVRYARR